MSTPLPPILLSLEQRRQIEADGVKAFPNECCGVIYGRDIDGRRIVERLESVSNAFASGEQYHRFSISAETLMKAEKFAAEREQLVLGFYHSHPDHPARPSEYDREHGWPFYSYVIVSIMSRKPAAMTSWLLNERTEQFDEQRIETRNGKEARQP
ncbi:MAG: M67 family metallopeptidase [Tepidisphaeraceae bacterium]